MKADNEFLQLKTGRQFINLLAKELEKNKNKYQNMGLVGVFGSKEINHDLDIICYPTKNANVFQFSKEQIQFLEEIKKKLKTDYKSDLIPFSMLTVEDEVEYLSQRKKGQVFLHNLVFTNHSDIIKRVPFLDAKIKGPKFEVLHGNLEALTQDHPTKLDFYFYELINNQVLLSNYPKELLSKKIKHISNWIRKYNGLQQEKTQRLLRPEECKKIYFETLNELDSISA